MMISVDLQPCSYPVGSTGVFNSHGKTSRGLRNISSKSTASKISSPILYVIFIQPYWAFQQGLTSSHLGTTPSCGWPLESLVQLGRLSGWSSCWRNWCNSLRRTCFEMLTHTWHMIITVCNVNIYVHLRVHVQRKNPHQYIYIIRTREQKLLSEERVTSPVQTSSSCAASGCWVLLTESPAGRANKSRWLCSPPTRGNIDRICSGLLRLLIDIESIFPFWGRTNIARFSCPKP